MQIAVLIVSLSVYGVAPIGFGTEVISQDVLVTALYPETIGFEEPQNFWIGPRQVRVVNSFTSSIECNKIEITGFKPFFGQVDYFRNKL